MRFIPSWRNSLLKIGSAASAVIFATSATAVAGEACRDLLTRAGRVPSPEMTRFQTTFGTANPIIGMIHLAGKSNKKVVERALEELALFESTGVHAAIIENYHGTLNQVEMVLAAAQGKFPKVVLGVNVLPNDYATAFRLARQYGARFIQLDYISGRYSNYQLRLPPTELNARDYYQYRRMYPEILVLGGVHPKYYKPIRGSKLNKDIRVAKRRADAIVVTGSGTGMQTPMDKITRFRELIGYEFPLVIGAGLTAENARQQLAIGNGAIVGSYFKDGETSKPVIPERIVEILDQSRIIQRGEK